MSEEFNDEYDEGTEGFEESEYEALTTEADEDDDADVSSEGSGAADERGEEEEASFGDDGSTDPDELGELEFVAGYDESMLESTRESLAESAPEERLLDAWYADPELGDPAIGAMLRGPAAASVFEVVIGVDDRRQITATTSYPWRAICSLKIKARDGSNWIGTGWLVGHRTVITAGHCVYIHNRGGWAREIEVIPGRNGTRRPYGSCKSSSLRSVKGWTRSKKRSHDYAGIILPRSCDYGRRLGYFGYGNYSTGTLRNLTVNVSGYPGDKPAGTQWWHARKIKRVTSRTIVYNIDTAGGQSGAPVWRIKNGKRYAVGIHTNGSSSGNSATRIVKAVYNNIKAWKALGQS
jgi:V8-like Glu-specific endopeptidase